MIAGVLGLVLGLVGAVLFALPSRGGETADSAEAKQVVARVTDFAIAYNTYDVADAKEYQDRLSGLLTSDYQEEFVKITDALFTAIKDKKQTSGGAQVLSVGIQSMDDDSAVVLAVIDAKVTNTDNEAAILRQFRWMIDLSKVDGTWRVAKFESVAALPADSEEGGEATPDPSASPDVEPGTEPSPTSTPSAEEAPE